MGSLRVDGAGVLLRRILVGVGLMLASLAAQASQADEYCLALNIYYEARAEVEQGKFAVAYVTLNRSRYRKQSICHVVFDYKQFSWVEQYKVLDENKHVKPEFRPAAKDRAWIACKAIAKAALAHPEGDFTRNAQFFVANYIMPGCLRSSCKWIYNLEFTGQYGRHMFFRLKKT